MLLNPPELESWDIQTHQYLMEEWLVEDCTQPKDDLLVPTLNLWSTQGLPHPTNHEVLASDDNPNNNKCSDPRLQCFSSTAQCCVSGCL